MEVNITQNELMTKRSSSDHNNKNIKNKKVIKLIKWQKKEV